jgi:hypothetical protein
MKMKFFFLAIFLNSASIAFAQENLKSYYDNIYKADDFIVAGRLDSAELSLRAAFAHKPKPFARHLYIYAIVNSKLGNFQKVSSAFKSLLELGMPFDKIVEANLFSGYLQSAEGKKMAKSYKKIKPSYDHAYRERIKLMLVRDQLFRTKAGSYSTYGDTIKKIDRENIDELMMLIRTKGFPTEQRVGIDEKLNFAPLFALLIIHQSSGPMQQYDFSELIREQVKNGNIENREGYFLFNRVSGGMSMSLVNVKYVKLIDTTGSRANPTNQVLIKTSDWGYFPLKSIDENRENLRRAEFFIEPYDKSIRKARFALKNPDFETMENKSSVSTLLMYKQEHYDAQVADLSF